MDLVDALSDPTATRNARLTSLLARIAEGDQNAFEELYKTTSPNLFAVAVRILGRSEAEEALQESFVSIWQHARSYVPDKSPPLVWLISIVRNRCLDYLRKARPDVVSYESEAAASLPHASPTPVEMLLAHADERAVRTCIEALNATHRQALALAFYQGLSHAELAAHLRQPLGTVKSYVRRGLEKLKQCLSRAGYQR